MASALAAVFVLAAGLGGAGPAHADAAVQSSATAIGLQGTGLLPLPPTPTLTASQPPDSGERQDALLNLSVPPLAVSASLTVVTEASQESRIGTPVFPELASNAFRRHVRETEVNARAFARAEGLSLVADGSQNLLQALLGGTLVSASAVETAAIARCVDNQALFDTDFNVANLRVLGQEAPLDQLLLPLLSLLDLPGVISIKQGEAGPLPGGGVFINGLHISIPALNVDIVVARSEARMPTPCGAQEPAVELAAAEAPALAEPAVTTAAPASATLEVAASQAELASTGTAPWLLPMGLTTVAVALAVRRLGRHARRSVPP